MPYYTDYWGYKYIHWACKDCIVRPMCKENCHRTRFKHYLCEPCSASNDCNSYPCKEVKKMQMYERVFNAYGDIMFEEFEKHLKRTSIFRLMKIPKKGESENGIWKGFTV